MSANPRPSAQAPSAPLPAPTNGKLERDPSGVARVLAWLNDLPAEWQGVLDDMTRRRAYANGIRVRHVRVTRTGSQTQRWFGQAHPERVRTCRGSRR